MHPKAHKSAGFSQISSSINSGETYSAVPTKVALGLILNYLCSLSYSLLYFPLISFILSANSFFIKL